jgi:hypothetical protein
VDDELFIMMEKLASAEGAGLLIQKHLDPVGDDPKLAELAESFVINVLEICGDPAEEAN